MYRQFKNTNQKGPQNEQQKVENDSYFNQNNYGNKTKYKLRNKDFNNIQQWFENSQKNYSPILQKEYKSIVDKNLQLEEKAHASIANAARKNIRQETLRESIRLTQSTFINENMFHHREPKIESLSSKQRYTYRISLQSIRLSNEFMIKNLSKISEIVNENNQFTMKSNTCCYMNVFACICSQQTGAYMGNPYEQKGIPCKVDNNFKQTGIITIKQQAQSVLCFYFSHGMKPNFKKIAIEVCLIGTSKQQFSSQILNLGKGDYKMNINNVNNTLDQIILKGVQETLIIKQKKQQKIKQENSQGHQIGDKYYQKDRLFQINRIQNLKMQKTQRQKNENTLKKNEGDAILCIEIQLNPVMYLYKLLPPLVIVDSSVFLPPASNISFKKKKYELTLSQQYFLTFTEFYLCIEDYQQARFLKQVQDCNPFQNYYQKDICFQIKGYHCLFGYHNSWKFISDQEDQIEISESSLKEKRNQSKNKSSEIKNAQFRQEIFYQMQTDGKGRMLLKGLPITKRYFDDLGQLLLIFRCQVEYWINSDETFSNVKSYKKRKVFNIGWLPVVPNLSSEITYLNQYLVNNIESQFPGYPIQIKGRTKLSTKIRTHEYQKHQKKKLATEQRQLRESDVLVAAEKGKEFLLKQNHQKTKNSKLFDQEMNKPNKKNGVSSTYLKSQNDGTQIKAQNIEQAGTIDFRIDAYLDIIQRKLSKQKVRPKGNAISIPNVQTLVDLATIDMDFLNHNLNQKTIQITIRIKSILPHTNCPSKYYIPRKFSGQIYIAGQRIRFQYQLSEQSQSISYGIPVYVKHSSKQHIVRVRVQNQNQVFKLIQGKICVIVFDDQNQVFYATGNANAISLFSSNQKTNESIMDTQQSKATKIWLRSRQHKQFGSLIIQHKISIKKINSKQIEQINTQSIVRTLPLKERLYLRVQNYNNKNKQKSNPNQARENHAAISIYRQRNHMNFVNKVISQEYQNQGKIVYQLGVPSYMFIPFSNNDSSTNDTFSISFNSDCAQIVTNAEQYNTIAKQFKDKIIASSEQEKLKQIPVVKNIAIDFKIEEEAGNFSSSGSYQTRIKSQEKIYILVKYISNQWYFGKSMPQNIAITFKRNTILVKQMKIKLTFKEPLIKEVFYVQDLIPQNLNSESADNEVGNIICIKIPYQIKQKSNFIMPFYKKSKYDKNNSTISLKIYPSFADLEPQKLVKNTQKNVQQIVVGSYEDQSHNKVLNYFIIRLKLFLGNQLRISVGQICKYTIPLNPSIIACLNKQKSKFNDYLQSPFQNKNISQSSKQQQIIIKIQCSSEDIVIPFKKIVVLSKYEEPKVLVNLLSPTKSKQPKKVLVSLVDIENNKVLQQNLLKINAKINPQLLFSAQLNSVATSLLSPQLKKQSFFQKRQNKNNQLKSYTIFVENYVGFRTSFEFLNKYNTGLHIFLTPSTENIVIVPGQSDIKAHSTKTFQIQVIRTIESNLIDYLDEQQDINENHNIYILVHDDEDNCIGIYQAKVYDEQRKKQFKYSFKQQF